MVNLTESLPRPGATIRFADSGGPGRPVVLSHGAGVDHTMFEPQLPVLRDAGYRVIVWDLRGHGASALDAGTRFTADDALDDLAALLDRLGLDEHAPGIPGADDLRRDRPVLVGHSLGGNLAQALVRRAPERVGGLVVLDSAWNAGPLGRLERLALHFAAPMLSAIPASRLPGLMARASAVHPAAVAQSEALFARMPKETFLDVWRATVSLVDPQPGYRTPVPLGLIRGAEDRTGNIATAMPRWAAAEGVPEHVVADAGHIVTLDAPDAVNDILLALLATMGARTGESPATP
ncbi:Pimeloyl-ACP methyl ester carboxylesterase [Promicromonospora umidemergens]|uniref:Alpha/beta hydrolase n=1 Tax=Promicromonospora umidemergens TaxID=629679 RepID=A0ABP8XJZ0_9MICO|nr:alpha/beta hydrolase [Promicromonospora umidemergens]MCP2282150.1 Pimeloyl-ACP methyl ester carboxylesterase [Promicromonospora umidemergens]